MSSRASAETASMYLVTYTTRIKMYRYPASLWGAVGPTMSTTTLLNGISINGINSNGTFLTIPFLIIYIYL